ncbi:membrane protein [Fervidicella metallireducens AeB]|uniref:Membrane protein n=1 Tax=Fervidicella metallireducens AeB TaxID=1403537 RepID=A0A017RSG6_9CLOT|nr:EamA family transporter [Fervidicella metallireducens]EYE87552.1 membrane protein [Fervidicella metallireducens AeB]
MTKGYLYIILSAFIFSTMELVSKMISSELNPFQLTFIRFLIGGLILLPFALKDMKAKKISLKKEDFLFLSMLAFLSIIISMTFFQLAVLYTKASTVAVIFSTNPIFTIPFAHLILKEKIDKNMIFSLFLSLGGIVLIFNPFNISPDYVGIILAVLSALTFSLYTVVGKLRIEKYGGTILNSFTFLIGVFMLLFIMLIFKIPVFKGINLGNIFQLVYLGVVVTGLGYLFYFSAIKETSASTASIVFFIKPALAPLLSFIILKESIPLNTLTGILLILFGAYVTLIKNVKTR